MLGEVRPERTGRRARRRILADVRAAIEHPRHDIAVAPHREQVQGLGLGGGADLVASGVITFAHGAASPRPAPRTIRCGSPVVPATTGNPSTRSSGSRPAARATAARSSNSSPNDGGSCSIHADAAREVDVHRDVARRRRLHHARPDASSDARVNAVPSVGCPANGSSATGREDPHS